MNELPAGWATANIDDLVSEPGAITDGPFGSNLKTSHYTDAGPRVIRLQNIGDGVFIDEEAHIANDHYQSLLKHAVNAGDLVIASLGTDLPRSCVIPPRVPPAIVKADCIRVRLHHELDPRFVNFMLNSPPLRRMANELVHGIGRPRLGLRGIRQLEIPIAPAAEQERIVEALETQLSRLDAVNASLRSARQKLVALRRSMLSSAVSGNWEQVPLSELTEDQVYGSSAKAAKDPDGGIPILRMGNIQNGRIDFTDLKYLPADHPDAEKLQLRPGDILFNRTNSAELVGKSAVFPGNSEPTVFASYLIRVRLDGNKCDPHWATFVLNSTLGREYIASVRTQQVGQANVNGTKLAAMPIPLPPPTEQQMIVERVRRQLSLADALEARLHASAIRTEAYRRAALELAASGRLASQQPGDEPASELLARIAEERHARPVSRRSTTVAA